MGNEEVAITNMTDEQYKKFIAEQLKKMANDYNIDMFYGNPNHHLAKFLLDGKRKSGEDYYSITKNSYKITMEDIMNATEIELNKPIAFNPENYIDKKTITLS